MAFRGRHSRRGLAWAPAQPLLMRWADAAADRGALTRWALLTHALTQRGATPSGTLDGVPFDAAPGAVLLRQSFTIPPGWVPLENQRTLELYVRIDRRFPNAMTVWAGGLVFGTPLLGIHRSCRWLRKDDDANASAAAWDALEAAREWTEEVRTIASRRWTLLAAAQALAMTREATGCWEVYDALTEVAEWGAADGLQMLLSVANRIHRRRKPRRLVPALEAAHRAFLTCVPPPDVLGSTSPS